MTTGNVLNGQSPHTESESGCDKATFVVRATVLDAVEHAAE